MAKVAKTEEMKPFMFERSFDEFDQEKKKPAANAEPAPEDIPEPEPEISFSEEEMNAQKQQSYMDGHADGFREGHAEQVDADLCQKPRRGRSDGGGYGMFGRMTGSRTAVNSPV